MKGHFLRIGFKALEVVIFHFLVDSWVRLKVHAKQALGVSQRLDESDEDLAVETSAVQVDRLQIFVIPNQFVEAGNHQLRMILLTLGSLDFCLAGLDSDAPLLNVFKQG